MTDLKRGRSALEKPASMRVSNGYFFGTLFSKINHNFLDVEALSMHVPILVVFIYAIFDSDILVVSFTYKHMNGPLKGTKKFCFFDFRYRGSAAFTRSAIGACMEVFSMQYNCNENSQLL